MPEHVAQSYARNNHWRIKLEPRPRTQLGTFPGNLASVPMGTYIGPGQPRPEDVLRVPLLGAGRGAHSGTTPGKHAQAHAHAHSPQPKRNQQQQHAPRVLEEGARGPPEPAYLRLFTKDKTSPTKPRRKEGALMAPSPQIALLEKSNKKVYERLQLLRHDENRMRELQDDVEAYEAEKKVAHSKGDATVCLKDVAKYAPAKWEEHIKERFDKDYEHLKDVQNRKVTMETNWHKQVEFNYNEKWRKREEQRELARLAELKAQMQRKVKVFMCAVTMASRLRHLALALHREKQVQIHLQRMATAAVTIQHYVRNVYLKRKQEQAMQAALVMQVHVRYWLKKSRPQRQAAAARVVKQMLLDLGNVSEMKDTVKNFMLRTRRLQNTVTVAVMKFHYRCSVLLNQWEQWEREHGLGEDGEPLKELASHQARRALSFRHDHEGSAASRAASGAVSRNTSAAASGAGEEPAGKKKNPRRNSASDRDLHEDPKSSRSRQPSVRVADIKWVPKHIKLLMVEEKVREMRANFVKESLQFKEDYKNFLKDWEENRMNYQSQNMKTGQTNQEVAADMAALKKSMAPVKPIWPILCTEQQHEEMYERALEKMAFEGGGGGVEASLPQISES